MATHKSAVKRHRQSLKRREHNRQIKATMRSAIKKTLSAAQGGNTAEAKTLLRQTEGLIASAATKHILHPRNARRKISRLASRVAAAGK